MIRPQFFPSSCALVIFVCLFSLPLWFMAGRKYPAARNKQWLGRYFNIHAACKPCKYIYINLYTYTCPSKQQTTIYIYKYIILYYIVLNYTTLYYIILYCIILYYIIFNYIIYCIIFFILYYITLYYITLYIVLYYTISYF